MLQPGFILSLQTPVMALIGNDAGWTQISREQVPILGSNVACGLAYTGEGLGLGGEEGSYFWPCWVCPSWAACMVGWATATV